MTSSTSTEHDDPAKLWKGASAFAHKNAVLSLKAQRFSPRGKCEETTALIVRPPRPATLSAKLHDKLTGPPFVYTHFRWLEAGQWRCINRTDLCTAYLRLCDEYDGLRRALQGLERLVTDNNTVSVGKELKCRSTFKNELEVIRGRGERLLPRLKWAVEHMAEYLETLVRCEAHNLHPPRTGAWAVYPDPVTAETVRLPEKEPQWKFFWNGNMEDYVFRAAKVVNKTETPEAVRVLREEIERVAREIIEFRGCKDTEQVWKYLPKKAGLPPPSLVVSTEPIADVQGIIEKMEALPEAEAEEGELSAPPAYVP